MIFVFLEGTWFEPGCALLVIRKQVKHKKVLHRNNSLLKRTQDMDSGLCLLRRTNRKTMQFFCHEYIPCQICSLSKPW